MWAGGGGRTVHKLAAIARKGKIYGIDHFEASVAASRRTNRQWIGMGRVEIQHGSVSHLPFVDLMRCISFHLIRRPGMTSGCGKSGAPHI